MKSEERYDLISQVFDSKAEARRILQEQHYEAIQNFERKYKHNISNVKSRFKKKRLVCLTELTEVIIGSPSPYSPEELYDELAILEKKEKSKLRELCEKYNEERGKLLERQKQEMLELYPYPPDKQI